MADQTTKDPYGPNGRVGRPSAGRLMKEVTEDLSTLVRKEIELAKQELGQAAAAKATGAVVIAIVGALAFFALIFLLLALRDGLDEIFWKWVADLLTAAILLLIGAIGALFARRKLATPIKADLTKQTIKEDVEFAKNIGRRS
ncbi:MAG TPA: phage holin family protein [Actinomycetota bacterium]|nr:phage holin family protein [Actinomycetota bacterium]